MPESLNEVAINDLKALCTTEVLGPCHLAILYGSRAYAGYVGHSDLDLLFVSDTLDRSRQLKLIEEVQSIHRRNGFELDNEVPFERKLIATFEDLEKAVDGGGFWRDGDRLGMTPVIKTPQFLNSEELRLRLLLNALAGNVLVLSDTHHLYNSFAERARTTLLVLASRLAQRRTFSIEEFIAFLVSDGIRSGEYYLGFKGDPRTRLALSNAFGRTLNDLTALGLATHHADGSFELSSRLSDGVLSRLLAPQQRDA